MLPYLRLVRVGTLFSPAADVVAGLCVAGMPIDGLAARAIGASVCLYAAGMVLNDHADRALDAVQRPERPIPRGDVAPNVALAFGVVLLAIALALSPMPIWHGAMAVLVLGYDYVWKQGALLGALTMGALRAANLASGPIVVAGVAPSDSLVVAASVYAVYVVAVTILGIYEDTPKVRPRAVVAVQMAPPIAAFLTILWTPQPFPAAAIAGVAAFAFCVRARRITVWTQAAIRGSMTWLLLGTMLYTGLLCMGHGRVAEALVVLAAIPVARWISRRIALT